MMTKFEEINASRVEDMCKRIDQIMTSAKSNKADADEVADLMAPLFAALRVAGLTAPARAVAGENVFVRECHECGSALRADGLCPQCHADQIASEPPVVADKFPDVRTLHYQDRAALADAIPDDAVAAIITHLVARLDEKAQR